MRTTFRLLTLLAVSGGLGGCNKTILPAVSLTYPNVLIVGNSIVSLGAQPRPDGWNSPALVAAGPAGWGRAASAPDNDFVHLLTKKFQGLNPAARVVGINQADFERSRTNYFAPGWVAANPAWNYDAWQDYITTTFGPAGADVVILRLGENVTDANVTDPTVSPSFQVAYNTLIDKTLERCPNAKVLLTNAIWYRPAVNEVIRQVAVARHLPLADLSDMLANPVFLAETDPATLLAFPTDQGDIHPGDAGMAEMANRIWNTFTGQANTPTTINTACPTLSGQILSPQAGATVIGTASATNAGRLTLPMSVSVCVPTNQTVLTVEIRAQRPNGDDDRPLAFATATPGRPGVYGLSYAQGRGPGSWPDAVLMAGTYRFYALITTDAGSFTTGFSLITLTSP